MNKIIYIFILFKILFINLNKTQENIFIVKQGEWNNINSWSNGGIPTNKDIALIGNQDNQICKSEIDSIIAKDIIIGYSGTRNHTFETHYGITSDSFIIQDSQSKAIFNIIPQSSSTNLEQYQIKIQNLTSNGSINIEYYIQSSSSSSNESFKFINNELDSLFKVKNSNFSIYQLQNTQSESSFIKSNIQLYSLRSLNSDLIEIDNSNITIFNSNYISLINNESKLIIKESIFKFKDNQLNDEFKIGVILDNGYIEIINSIFESSQYIGILNSSIVQVYNGSKVYIDNRFDLLMDSMLLVNNSNLDITDMISLQDNSMLIVNEASLMIYGHFDMMNSSYAYINKTSLTLMKPFDSNLTSDDLVFLLNDNSYLLVYESTLALFSNILTEEQSIIYFINSSIYCNSSMVLGDHSQFLLSESLLFIYNTFQFYENSILLFNSSSSVYVYGYIDFYDSSVLIIDSSIVTVNGYINVDQKNEMFINNTILTLQSGDFINYGYFQILDSEIRLFEGSFILKKEGSLYCNNSLIEVYDGVIELDPSASITIFNSKLINKYGTFNVNGDIIVESASNLNNSAIFNLNSNIKSINQSQQDQQYFNNQGKLNITGSNISIDIELLNDGGLIHVINQIKMLSLNQMNNSNLILSSGSSSLNISNNLNTSINDSITFTIDDNNVSKITIDNQAIINNSTLIIRINKDSINNDKNSTLMTYSNLNGSGFNAVQFKSFDPKTGTEEELEYSDCRRVESSKTSLKILITNCSSHSSKLTSPQIIGIVFGIVGLAIVIGSIIYFKKSLYFKLILLKENAINLKNINKD